MILLGSPLFYIGLLCLLLFLLLKGRFRGVFFKVIGFNLIFMLFSLALFDSLAALLTPEANSSFRLPDKFYHHGLKPLILEETAWDPHEISFYKIATNSLGFVDETNRVVPLKKSGKRTLFLGDSFIEGVGYPWEQTAAGILSEKYKKRGVELLNASVVSYSPKLYYLKLKRFLDLGLEIDELFVFIDISDVIDEVVYDYFKPEKFSVSEDNKQKIANFFIKGSYLYKNFIYRNLVKTKNPYNEHSAFWGGLNGFYLLKPKWTYDDAAYKLYGKKGVASAIKYMNKIEALCRQKGIKLHICVWPWQTHVVNKTAQKQYNIWNKFAKEHSIDFISLFALFEAMDEKQLAAAFIKNDIHWSALGNKAVADYLWEHISKDLEEN